MATTVQPSGGYENASAPNLTHASLCFRFGSFEFDLPCGELRRDGVRISLQKKSLQLLTILIDRAGEVVLRDELRAGLWPADTFVDFDANIKTAVNRLRKVLRDSAENPVFIETIPRKGFRFIAPVTRVDRVIDPPDAPAQSARFFTAGPKRAVWGFGVVLALIVAVTGAFTVRSRPVPKAPGTPLLLLVLPLDDMSSDGSQRTFSDGFTDELITFLGGRAPRELSVIDRTSAMQYRGTRKPLSEIARELGGADYVLEGSVRRAGSHVAINTELVRVADQAVLWAQTYDRQLSDLLAVQQDVAERVCQSLFNRLLPAQVHPAHVPAQNAYDNYLTGVYYQQNRRDGQNLLKSLGYFEKAIEDDPSYAEPHAAIAYSYLLAAGWEMLKPSDAYPKALAAAERALQLDPNLAEAHVDVAEVEHEYYWKWAEPEMEFRRAIDLNPNSSIAHKSYADFLMHAGRYRESIEEIDRAVGLDPLALGIRLLRAHVYLYAKENDRAQQECETILRIDPQYAPASYLLGAVYLRQHRYDDALAQFKTAAKSSEGSPKMVAEVARTYALLGREADAERLLHQIQRDAHDRYTSAYTVAGIYAAMGDKARAFEWLQKAVAERSSDIVYMRDSPDFDNLHDDPRFDEVAQTIGFPPER